MQIRFLVCVLATALCACSSAGGPKSPSTGANPKLITADEIAASHEPNAYEAIRSLRPNMLVVHGPTSVQGDDPGIVVYVNGQRYGDLNSLREISANEIREIRFLNPAEAQYRYGAGYPEGIIEVKTR
jgi:hypothetical protein